MEHQLEINYDQNFTKENFEFLEKQMKQYFPTLFTKGLTAENYKKLIDLYDKMQQFDNQEVRKCVTQYCNLEDDQAVYLCWLAHEVGQQKAIHLKTKA